ncbi:MULTISPECIES: LysR family substrate-binding domain-containing protein [Gammaproteobacteria]|uniref:LysR family substrate-binding domain-containing protein n=1 Tax=Xanthomonas hortorum TaxID=56454 RepID=A0AA47EW68_9XANT|nr:LysR family substrate-binding domain-containing protein [Xanthomonas hortorum]MCE4363171.1 LysR family substrate-binding domain-containing protein [Xanthomonas hortorum]MCE4372639.1 LysR family substrate-binding domain-containing protein [Xanthomonas hortorum pv. hederae]PPU70466.1 transcriptional regulator [Xanthomonas hortorum pv. hederae]PUE98792.1 transcriptional regulator [Xanthomonas hortorum pv. hederae]WAH66503.1 LysR family substrate-binding domain-containing protein [Xanthomonas h
MNQNCCSRSITVAASSAVLSPLLADLLALQRTEEPETPVRLQEVTQDELTTSILGGTYDLGIGWPLATDALAVLPLWRDRLAIALPTRSPLLAHQAIPLPVTFSCPLICWHPHTCVEGLDMEAGVDDCSAHLCSIAVTSFDLLTVLVAAGYGIGIAPQSYIVRARNRGIVMRHILGTPRWVYTCLFRSANALSPAVERFVERASRVAMSTKNKRSR